jgi:hypothetical protein
MPYRREGDCNDCGECCGTSGDPPFPIHGWEAIDGWDETMVHKSYAIYPLFGLELIGGVWTITTPYDSIKLKGINYYFVWVQQSGFGTIPLKDTSVAHDGSSSNTECPFLKDDPGDGSRPCAINQNPQDQARQAFCRPEEHAEYVPAEDIWTDQSKAEWEADHPSCPYTWVSV